MPLLPTDPKKQRLILLALLAILGAGAYWYLLYSPAQEQIAADRARLEALQTKNATAKALASRGGPELKKKLALYEQHIAMLEALIPKSEEVPELLHDITLRAEESGVDLNLVRPEKSTAGDFYARQVYSMSVVGPYEGVGRFLTAVGSLPRIVTPVHLKVVPRVDVAKSGARNLQAEFQIQTYIAPDATAKPARAVGKDVANARA